MASDPQSDADRIRLKRLAKLQGAASSSTPSPTASGSSTPAPAPPPEPPKPKPAAQAQKRPVEPVSAPSPVPPKKKTVVATAAHLDIPVWEDVTISNVLNVTLQKEVAEKSAYEVVWLKHLAEELQSDGIALKLNLDVVDRCLIARLELDPEAMSDDLEFLPVLASLPAQTTLEYLIGCWKRLNSVKVALLKKNYVPTEQQRALDILEKLRDLVISYAGLTLQEPEMFPQPVNKVLGALELIPSFMSLSTFSGPYLASSSQQNLLTAQEIETFLQDLVRRFGPDNEIDSILGPVVVLLAQHHCLSAEDVISTGDEWRGVLSGLEALVSNPAIAQMVLRLPEWNPEGVTAEEFGDRCLLGPLLGLGVFERDWPGIAKTYFSNSETRPQGEIVSAMASLRGTLKTLQSSLFSILNSLVRASPNSKEPVLQFFARAINVNRKRAGMQVDYDTVSSDCFMMNVQAILLQFCEPFMDATYSKMDRIDAAYYAHTSRVDLTDETRINATNDEAEEWRKQNEDPAASPKFISDIFYLTLAANHIGQMKLIDEMEHLLKQADEIRKHVERLESDQSWRGTPLQPRYEHAINASKAELDKCLAAQLCYATQLADPDMIFRSVGFVNFVSTWILRQVDPRRSHPKQTIDLPLPKEVPMSFRVLPEYLIEDVIEYHIHLMRTRPQSLELSGRQELLVWCLTWLTSTWYIKNPFLKAKIVEVIAFGTWAYGNDRKTVLTSLLNTHSMALKHLMPSLMQFYIEVEQTGASSQFYDKFNSRQYISLIFKQIWSNPEHREALNNQAVNNTDRFVRFVNLMINDVTYLLDESLRELAQIHEIETEMRDTATFEAQPQTYRRERESTLRGLERHASGYVQLGNSTVELLKTFTSETKSPFMVPEIVDKLAAMLDYNLDALVGPRYQELKVANPEKFKFKPRQLLSDILQVYINLSDQGEFARAVAADGRSYSKALFEQAGAIARLRGLKSPDEIEKLRLFVVKVEETKATLEAEEELGDIPDEFLDPLMYTLMRDPVILPSSKAVVDRSTIKSHLLSDTKDPFNRVPLTIEEVTPDVELKAKIDAFLAERHNKTGAFDQAPEDLVHMDTSTD